MTQPEKSDSARIRIRNSHDTAAGQLNSVSRQIDGKATTAQISIALAQAIATLAVAEAIDNLADAIRGTR